MKTIKQVFEEFLEEQEARLKPRTYRGYEDAMYLFEECLNGYAYQYLDAKERKRFDRLCSKGDKEFCDVFGPDKIGANEVGEFLDYFMIRKVIGSKELMKTVGRVIRGFVKWVDEKGYMDKEEYEITADLVDELKDALPEVEELSGMIYDYIQNRPLVDFTQTLEGYFRVTKVKPGKLWLEDSMEAGNAIGPVIVSVEISSRCKVGWVINLALGKTRKGWEMLESGNVYPR